MSDSRYPHAVLLDFATRAFVSAGLDHDQSAEAAGMLLRSDLRGIASHGLGRLAGYVSYLQRGFARVDTEVEVLRETPVTLALDGNLGLGLLVGPEAMRRTIAKARQSGLCMTTVRNSNHFGIAGNYAMMAVDEGLCGLAMTNSSRVVVPLYGRTNRLGTNPIAFAVPTSNEPFVLDMSTSTVAWGKIEIARRAGLPIPEGWGVDAEGYPTTDPNQVVGLTPLGGTRELSGHKGYGLGLLVEVLTGPLSGGVWSNHVARQWEQDEPPGTGHFFMVWQIEAFRDREEFIAAMDQMVAELRDTPTADHAPGPVLVPGDPEIEAERVNQEQGIPVAPGLIRELREMADRVGITHPFGGDGAATAG